MNILYLDPAFAPEWSKEGAHKNTYTIAEEDKHIFAGGEVHLSFSKVIRASEYARSEELLLIHRLNSSDAVMELLMATNALRGMGFEKLSLFMPYVPYARQDRRVNPGEPFSLEAFAELINAQRYHTVHMLSSKKS